MRFDITDLKLFLSVVETGSITQGAGRAHLALASASARVRGMEAALGVDLLVRGRRGVVPTAAGRTLAQHARIVLAQIEHLRGELGGYARGLKGEVRMLSNTAALTEFLPETLARFLAANRHVDIDLEERESTDIVQAVADGRADIGVVAEGVDMSGLECFPFRTDRLVLVVPRGHALAKRRQVAFAEALSEEFVGLSEASALQHHLGRHAAKAGRPLKLRVRLRGFDAICRMVEQGVGVAAMPATAAARFRRSMRISTVRLTDAWALRKLHACVRSYKDLTPHAKRLVDALRSGGERAG
ncbi:MAG: LysR family transcriptional regulator [Hyphomicrobiaceae bacterium]|nr:MAG: LysR family transcriptional regulator [Hyphomicrobiaceae bacterium]